MSVYVWMPVAYLLGSVPFGLVIARLFSGKNLRAEGSGNIGATNVARTCGAGFGILALALDLLKGAAPTALALWAGGSALVVSLTAFAAVAGHVFPVYLGFKGGKAVATTIGVFLPIAAWPMLCSVGLCVALIGGCGYVSVGSLGMAASLPIFVALFGRWEYLPLALAIAALIVWRHKDNINRLRQGEEKSWRKKGRQQESRGR